jgi:hypothetical protein
VPNTVLQVTALLQPAWRLPIQLEVRGRHTNFDSGIPGTPY